MRPAAAAWIVPIMHHTTELVELLRFDIVAL
jgi:hypothetical protein